MKKTIVVGVGNPILGDDGVGIHVLRLLKERLKERKDSNVVFEEALTGGMNLLDLILDYDRAILIDAVKGKQVGEVSCFQIADSETIHSFNPHDMSFLEAIQLAKRMGEDRIPQEIVVVGITVSEISSFKENLSKEVAKAIPKAVEMVLSKLYK